MIWRRVSVCLSLLCLLETLWLITHYTSSGSGSTDGPVTEESATKSPNASLLQYYKRLFVPQGYQLDRERLTLVMLTYKREDLLPRVLGHYCPMVDTLESILVIWNDVNTPVPSALLRTSCQVTLKFIASKENRLTNRFLPRKEITTEGVLIVDDDRLISRDDVHFGFQIWQQFRQRIVGFEHRMHSHNREGAYHYGPSHESGDTPEKLGYSMLISASFIIHKIYLELFHSSYLPAAVYDHVNAEMNCEDIAMCVLVAKFLQEVSWPQSAVLSVKPKVTLKNLEAMTGGDHHGLSNQFQHYDKRSQCLNKFAAAYGGTLPLVYINGRIYREPIKPWYDFKLTKGN